MEWLFNPRYQGLIFGAMFVFLGQLALVKIAQRRAFAAGNNRTVHFFDLVVTCEDESYSLSRLQMYLWTVAIIIGFIAVFFAQKSIPNIPERLGLLMGVNMLSAVVSSVISTGSDPADGAVKPKDAAAAAQELQKAVGSIDLAKPKRPDFFRDLFFESEGSLDLPRTQMFAWTIISLVAYFVMLPDYLKELKVNEIASLPNIPLGLVGLMGVSHGAYLGIKARNKI